MAPELHYVRRQREREISQVFLMSHCNGFHALKLLQKALDNSSETTTTANKVARCTQYKLYEP